MSHDDHYFSVDPRAEHDLRLIEDEIRGVPLKLWSDAGVFSKGKVDRGTRILLEEMPLPEGGPVLDLGCGYGPIGITLAKLLPGETVYMSDPNRRAVDLARKNAAQNGVRNVEIVEGEGYSPFAPELRFQAIVTNPPLRAGKKVVYALVSEAPEWLHPGGTFTCVAQTKQGAKSLRAHMQEVFGNVHEVAKEGGYRVLHSIR